MNISESFREDVVVLHLSGDVLGGPEAQQINEVLRKHIQDGKKRFVLDVSQVGLVNSSGLGLLIAGLSVVRNAGGELKLAGASSKLAKLLEITKLSQVFEQHSDVDEAVRSFSLT